MVRFQCFLTIPKGTHQSFGLIKRVPQRQVTPNAYSDLFQTCARPPEIALHCTAHGWATEYPADKLFDGRTDRAIAQYRVNIISSIFLLYVVILCNSCVAWKWVRRTAGEPEIVENRVYRQTIKVPRFPGTIGRASRSRVSTTSRGDTFADLPLQRFRVAGRFDGIEIHNIHSSDRRSNAHDS